MQAAHVIKNSLAALAVTLGTSESGITPTEQDSVVQRHLLPVLASFDLLFVHMLLKSSALGFFGSLG